MPGDCRKAGANRRQKGRPLPRTVPAIKVNLIDGVGGKFKTQVRDELEFVDLLGKLGVRIDFFIGDVQWSSNWQANFEELATKLHARGIKVGMYCNGLLASNSDLTWDRE